MTKLVNKFILLFSLMVLLMIIPASFALDDDAGLSCDESADVENSTISVSENDMLKGTADYYFDASAENDGDGTLNSPYKYLKSKRIVNNSTIHLANGEYELDYDSVFEYVNFIGSDVDKTVISSKDLGFFINGSATIKNITFLGLGIVNMGNLTATNSIFAGSDGTYDGYGNFLGGAILSDDGSVLTVSNCKFMDNNATAGGAIYMSRGVLDVSDSIFIRNRAYSYGGAIACDYDTRVKISKSKFYDSSSVDDAGGAIYIKASTFAASDLEIINSSATFGGAITTLGTDVSLNGIKCINSTAEWDGGAIYHMYGDFTLTLSDFENNNALNGGALYIVNSNALNVENNKFYYNNASCAGAVYCLLDTFVVSLENNVFLGNTAEVNDTFWITDEFNLNIGNGDYAMYNVIPVYVDKFPSRYSLVDEGYVTSVKDQAKGGNCWAFAALAALESCILKASNVTYDFSEENLKNLMGLYSIYGYEDDTNDGGRPYMAWGYLSSWLGPVYDADDEYNDMSTLSAVFDSIVHVQNILFLNRDNFTDNDAIKEALMKYGAVASSMYSDEDLFDDVHHSYYCEDEYSSNHAVTIVGWDDDFPASNFTFTPPGDGAWIIKNSWGTTEDDDGYFYLSYYDGSFTFTSQRTYTFILNDTVRFDKNYQYDIAGKTNEMYYEGYSNLLYKNVFTASDNEFLAAVSTYFVNLTDWTVTINVNGESKAFKSGTSNPGYYTINLDDLIAIKKGDVFEVIFNVTSQGNAFIPISEAKDLNNDIYSAGMSYESLNGGKTWMDLYADELYANDGAVACIKAFTILNPIETFLSLYFEQEAENLINIIATVVDEDGNPVEHGHVILNLDGVDYLFNLTNGIVGIQYSFKGDSKYVSASFDAPGYSHSFNEAIVDFSKTKVTLNLDISQELYDASLLISCSNIINETVIVEINDNPFNYRLVNGRLKLVLEDLSNGVYDIDVYLPQTSIYECDALTDSFVVDVHKTQIIAKDLKFSERDMKILNVTLLDDVGNPLSGSLINITVGGYSFSGFSDVNGVYCLPLMLDVGNYVCSIRYDGDDSHIKSAATIIINVDKFTKNSSQVLISIGKAEIGKDVDLDIYVPNATGDVLVIYDGGSNQFPLDENGYCPVVIDKISAGEHVLDVIYLGDENHEMSNSSEIIYVNKLPSKIALAVSGPIIGADTTIGIEVSGATGNVLVFVDGVRYSRTLDNGKTQLSVPSLAVGNHDIVVVYVGDETYESSYANMVVNGTALESRFTGITVSGSGEINAILVDESGRPISNADIDYTINGAKFKTTTNRAGQLTIQADSNTVVEISYKGTNWILPSDISLTLKDLVKPRQATNVIGKDYTQYAVEYGIGERGGNFTVQLVDQNGKPLANKIVYIGYNGKCLNRTTDSKGFASVQINLASENRLTFAVAFLGDEDYNATMSVYLVTINKKPVTISAPTKTFKASAKTKSYTVTLTTVKAADGKTYFGSGKAVTLSVGGKTYSAKTNANGQATFKLNLNKKGTYSATVNYAGDGTYAAAKVTTKIKIN
ncbi:Ig-like domain repeat protein [uncultured Methanobrevibacter sp.]|uniref:Ig-like domain repeat protein n=1 Tax=uncultured Methanobrevibacter sp. TaxID=253161 RepID=UPI00262C2C38|nr:Ig-like domain repeat protein [uncultured Methanobrevibacter sp.]